MASKPQPVASPLDRIARRESAKPANPPTRLPVDPQTSIPVNQHTRKRVNGYDADTEKKTINLVQARADELTELLAWAKKNHRDRTPTQDALIDYAIRMLYAKWEENPSTGLPANAFRPRHQPKEQPATDYQNFK